MPRLGATSGQQRDRTLAFASFPPAPAGRSSLACPVLRCPRRSRGEGARDEPAPVVPRGPGPDALAGARRGGGGRPRAADAAQALVGPDRLRRARGGLRGERRRVQGAEGPPGGEPRRGGRAPPQAPLAVPAVGSGAALRGLRISGSRPPPPKV